MVDVGDFDEYVEDLKRLSGYHRDPGPDRKRRAAGLYGPSAVFVRPLYGRLHRHSVSGKISGHISGRGALFADDRHQFRLCARAGRSISPRLAQSCLAGTTDTSPVEETLTGSLTLKRAVPPAENAMTHSFQSPACAGKPGCQHYERIQLPLESARIAPCHPQAPERHIFLTLPLLILQAGKDAYVDNQAESRLPGRGQKCASDPPSRRARNMKYSIQRREDP